MKKASLMLLLALAGLAAGLTSQPSAGAHDAKVRLVDRTLVCKTGVQGGARVMYISARSAYGAGDRLEWLAQASVGTEGQPLPTKPYYQPTLVGVTAGWPPPRQVSTGGLGFDKKLCSGTRRTVPFSRRGLTGGPAAQLGDEYTCVVQRTILVRVRAVFRSPAAVKAIDKRSYAAVGRIERAQIAARTLSGKPLVYAELGDSGRTRLFTTGNCF